MSIIRIIAYVLCICPMTVIDTLEENSISFFD
jgi:hypothetical protein